ncbi:pyridoxamine 5'-phosphate oxidase family protein [Catellatospora tritici]|uniref:pyridoxamine 5'-phosphate oxidase family protein n=1 Tax=Catellatospora tritici TaxID=2851566 RepID=UPI001C2CE66D|nr:pyridoxamine 5'-phosphate oxidase [Catellatospora tritici]MBV1853315.1 pyridoxamine 5'-phosphate oxidase [Catellatospora tritici]
MATWSEFAAATPWLASSIRALLHQYGPGMGFLATVRADGSPRLHPVSPIVTDEGLYCFILDTPKRRDLDRDGRYALHAYPAEDSDVEACVTGRAYPVTSPVTVDHLARTHRAAPLADWRLYEFAIETALLHRHEPDTLPVLWRDRRAPLPEPAPRVERRAARPHLQLLAA